MASFSRSHHVNKITKLLTVYFKSCGLATKAFDTLNALGITMSQKWSYTAIEQLAKRLQDSLHNDINRNPWFGTHDNVNIPFKVYEQRLGHQSHFDSGTAATIIILKDPAAVRPDAHAYRQHLASVTRHLTVKDVYLLDRDAGPKITERVVSTVLSFLTGATAFDLPNSPYSLRKLSPHSEIQCASSTMIAKRRLAKSGDRISCENVG